MATINIPYPVPSPVEDAEALRKACKGWGTDEKGVIEVIAHRGATQRKLIREAYEEIYGENLIKRLESELSGAFERAVYRWMFDPLEREAIIANVAVKENDYRVLVEVACINSTDELLALKQAYHARYKHSFEEDVASNITGDFRSLLVALVSTYKYKGDDIDAGLAKCEAKVLHEAIQEKRYNHEEVIRILSTRSKAQLIATFNQYKDEYGTSITKDLSGDSSNEFVAALRAAIRCTISPIKYFEKLLRSATTISGNEDIITRVFVTRAEKDLKEIQETFEKRNTVTLGNAISKATSGNHKKFLLALLGN